MLVLFLMSTAVLQAVPTSSQRLATRNRDSVSFQWKLRRMVERVMEFVDTRTTKPCPKTNVALQSVRAALSDEMPQRRPKRTMGRGAFSFAPKLKRSNTDINTVAKKHYDRCRRLKKKNEALQAELDKRTAFRVGTHNQITPHWIVRAFLSQPALSARGGATLLRDIAGMDAPVLSRTSIERIRDAWITKFKPMVLKIAADRLRSLVAGVKQDPRLVGSLNFVCVWWVHCQDEADIKLRSREDDGHDVLRRSRASKVQQNVLRIADQHGILDIPTELVALGDKTAATLATCFDNLLRHTVSAVVPA